MDNDQTNMVLDHLDRIATAVEAQGRSGCDREGNGQPDTSQPRTGGQGHPVAGSEDQEAEAGVNVRNYAVEIEGWGHRSTLTVTASTPAKARYLAWFEINEPTGITFAEFLSKWVRAVRLSDRATRYTYAAERYGVSVVAGQEVALRRGGHGVVAEPPGSNDRAAHIYICMAGGPPQPYHPCEIQI